MSVSFTLYRAAGQRFDPCSVTTTGNSPSRTPMPPMSSTVSASRLLLRTSVADRLLPALLIVARRKRLGHASPAIRLTEMRKPGTMLVIDCGRAEGYIEQKFAKLSDLVNEGFEIGATHVGWG